MITSETRCFDSGANWKMWSCNTEIRSSDWPDLSQSSQRTDEAMQLSSSIQETNLKADMVSPNCQMIWINMKKSKNKIQVHYGQWCRKHWIIWQIIHTGQFWYRVVYFVLNLHILDYKRNFNPLSRFGLPNMHLFTTYI